MGILVQLIVGIALIVCLAFGLFIFIKSLSEKQGRHVLFQFAGIEALIFILIMLTLLILVKRIQSIPVYIVISLIFTLFANIPLAIIAIIINFFIKKSRK